MKPKDPFLLRVVFSFPFQIGFVLVAVFGLFLYSKFPSSGYQGLVQLISHFLKTYIGTRGTLSKIDFGLQKIGFLVVGFGVGSILFFQIWRRILNWVPQSVSDVSSQVSRLEEARPSKHHWLGVFLLILLAAILRIFNINQSLYHDEIATIQAFILPGPMATIMPKFAMGIQPFLQLVVMAFIPFTGLEEWSLRLPAFLFALATIPLIYFIALRMTRSQIVAFSSVLFLIFHTYHIYYSFQMRGYVIVTFFALLSTYFTWKILQNPHRPTTIYLAICNILLVYTHFFSVFFLMAQHLCIIFLLFQKRKWKDKKEIACSRESFIEYFLAFLLSGTGIILLYIPILPNMAMIAFSTGKESLPILKTILQALERFHWLIAFTSWRITTLLFTFLVLLFHFLFVKRNLTNDFIYFNLLFLLGFLFIMPAQIQYGPRYYFAIVPLFILSLAFLVDHFWKSPFRFQKLFAVGMTLAFIGLSLSGFSKTYEPMQDYRGAIGYIEKRAPKGVPILANLLGKNEAIFYNPKIIPLKDLSHLNGFLINYDELYAVTTFHDSLKMVEFAEDTQIQKEIEKHFQPKVFPGRIPVYVWHYKKP